MINKVKNLKYRVFFKPAEEGGYVVSVPTLPGCITQGDTFEEAVEMVKDAIQGYCASLAEDGEPIPEELGEEFIGVVKVPIQISA